MGTPQFLMKRNMFSESCNMESGFYHCQSVDILRSHENLIQWIFKLNSFRVGGYLNNQILGIEI